MEASAKTIRKILESGDQYLIPFFQRSYSWKKKHWERLWSDILNLADDEKDQSQSQHFLGPLVCTLARATPGEIAAYQLIDGSPSLPRPGTPPSM